MLAKGAIARKAVLEVRSLTREELGLLKAPRQSTGPVQKLRDPHHLLARLLASGLRDAEAASRAGYTIGRLGQLRKDPAFVNLIEHYRSEVSDSWRESVDTFHELATSNMLKAERMLAEKIERVEEEGDFLPTRDLIAITSDRADRFGYGKKNTNLNINVDFAAQLERAIGRSRPVLESRALPSNVTPSPVGGPQVEAASPLPVAHPLRRRA